MTRWRSTCFPCSTTRPSSPPRRRWLTIDVFNEQLQADGHWVFAGGLASPDTATVVDGRDGEAVFTDGPYLESKEYIAGFWIIEAADLDVALRLAGQGLEGLQPEGRGPAVPEPTGRP